MTFVKQFFAACLFVSFIATLPLYAQPAAFDGEFEWVNPPLGAETFQKIRQLGTGNYEIYTRTYILHSTDNGKSWKREQLDSLSLQLSMRASFSTPLLGWALLDPYSANSDPTVMKTTDGGHHWSIGTILESSLRPRSISFATDKIGWIVGDNGLILQTTDGGNTWKPSVSLTGNSLYTVFSISSRRTAISINSTGLFSRTSGLFMTTDNGAHWDTLGFVDSIAGFQSIPIISDIAFPDSTHGFVFTMSGQIYRTTNGGSHWQRMLSNLPDTLDKTYSHDIIMPS